MIRLARMGRDEKSPDTVPLFNVRVETAKVGDRGYEQQTETVLEQVNYAVASQLCYILNYKFGDRGALAVLGRQLHAGGGELVDRADAIAARILGEEERA